MRRDLCKGLAVLRNEQKNNNLLIYILFNKSVWCTHENPKNKTHPDK